MFKQPAALTTHVTIFGDTNVGKSTLFNALLGQDRAIISPHAGTTTDPVQKRVELIPYGPIILTDTAGLNDTGVLGEERVRKSNQVVDRTDFGIVLFDAALLWEQWHKDRGAIKVTHPMEKRLKERNIPYIQVATKGDLLTQEQRSLLLGCYPELFVLSLDQPEDLDCLRAELVKRLEPNEDTPLVANLVKKGSTIVLVVPIDSEAPKGRIILPQVQVIRDCLDHGVNALVTNEINLPKVLDQGNTDLVVTDSQAFHLVKDMVGETPLTSFSIILARFKGDLSIFYRGVSAVEGLHEESHILISESCSHNVGHEDIGEVKIPKLLHARLGKGIRLTHVKSHDFPLQEELKQYDLVIHCGSCMLNRKVMQSRLALCAEAGVPITNYGVYLAYENGILDRAVEIFKEEFR